MVAALMLHALVVGAFTSLGALAGEWACRALRRPTRWAWAGAMLITLVLVVLAPLRGHGDLTEVATPSAFVVNVDVAPDAGVVGTIAGTLAAAVAEVRAHLQAPVPHFVQVLARWVRGPRLAAIGEWLLAAWAVASLALLVVTVVTARRLTRARHAWPAVELQGETVHVAPRSGPAVVGLARARIVVPGWLLGRPAPEQRIVVAHEREHVRARDPLLLAFGSVVTIALPWHPLAWWMQARLRLAVELDCDERVLRSGVAPARYGALLLDVAGREIGTPFGFPALGVPALAPRAHHLERRLVAMTSPRPRHPLVRFALAHVLAGLAVLAACETRLPTSAELERLDVATTEKKLAITPDSTTRYFVDDMLVSAAEAHEVAAGRIVSVTVNKNEAAGGTEIRVGTKQIVSVMKAHGASATPNVTVEKTVPASEARFEGIVFVDGVRTSLTALHGIAPASIASIEVFKGAKARQLYPGELDAAKGVIKVTTKPAPR